MKTPTVLPWVGIFGLVLLTVRPVPAQDLEYPIPLVKSKVGELHFAGRLGGTTPATGKPFSMRLIPPGGRLLSVQVCLSPLPPIVVHALRFTYLDAGKARLVKETGNCQEKWLKPYVVPANRQLVGMSGSSGWMVDSIRFHLDDNTTSELFGGSGGNTEVSIAIKKDAAGRFRGEFQGIWGTRIDGRLESLGLVFSRSE